MDRQCKCSADASSCALDLTSGLQRHRISRPHTNDENTLRGVNPRHGGQGLGNGRLDIVVKLYHDCKLTHNNLIEANGLGATHPFLQDS